MQSPPHVPPQTPPQSPHSPPGQPALSAPPAPPAIPAAQEPTRKILIVDDSAVMRSLLRSVILTNAHLEVIGTAADGLAALKLLDSLRPDLILLDVEMPIMDGLSTLKQIRSSGRRIPIIMCSALTHRGAQVTIEALANGAADYVAKPSGQASPSAAIEQLAADLVPKILALTVARASLPIRPTPLIARTPTRPVVPSNPSVSVFGRGTYMQTPLSQNLDNRPALPQPVLKTHIPQMLTPPPLTQSAATTPTAAEPRQSSSQLKVHHAATHAAVVQPEIILIGVSTGGPTALDVLLPKLPADFPIPILIVQHMPTLFTKMLAERLDSHCPMHIVEASDGDQVQPGVVHIAKGDWHMSLAAYPSLSPSANAPPRITIRLNRGALENHCRPAVDVLFRSAVAIYGPKVLGIILTGMGADGLAGCRLIRERGGAIFAQDEATSAVWGMPGAIVHAGLANRVLPLDQIAPEILRLLQRKPNEARALRESAV